MQDNVREPANSVAPAEDSAAVNSSSRSSQIITEKEATAILHEYFFIAACAFVFMIGMFVKGLNDFLSNAWWYGVGIMFIGGVPLCFALRRNHKKSNS